MNDDLFIIDHKTNCRHLNLEKFKVQACQLLQTHNPKLCPYYHSQQDRRRCNTHYAYDVEFCTVNNCSDVETCKFTHNKVERLYHIAKYKTKYCT